MMLIRNFALAWLLSTNVVWAAQVSEFIPMGQASDVESIQATFDEAMTPFGDAQWPAPFDIQCNDPSVSGAGRWLSPQRWTYVFERKLDAGVQCRATLRDGVRTLHDQVLQGQIDFQFNTGGPRVIDTRPYSSVIDENQVFVLTFNAQIKPESLVQHSRCVVDGLGEEVPVRLVTGSLRTEILSSLHMKDALDSGATQLLQCTRRLSADADMQLVVGPGVETGLPDTPGLTSQNAAVFQYQVRPEFRATLSCRRENARAPCLPVMPVGVAFTSPVSAADAAGIRLLTPDGVREPDLAADDSGSDVSFVTFSAPLPEQADMTIELPDNLRDDAGRELVNADMYPLRFNTAAYPPLIKFPSDTFGIIERFAVNPQGAEKGYVPATAPLVLRNVESTLLTRDMQISAGQVRDMVTQDGAAVLRWYAQVRRLQQGYWTAAQIRAIRANKAINYGDGETAIDSRSISLLADQENVRVLTLPGADTTLGWRPSEVIGVPVPDPGFHILEVESPRLGQSLLEHAGPMYVRTTVLVTNLGVHLKQGRDDALVWVTTLDEGKVVPGAVINILDCAGKKLASGMTDDQGLWHYRGILPAYGYCEETGLSGIFASARIPADHPQAGGQDDFSFVMSDWNDGIESWRFNVPVNTDTDPTRRAHTILDRVLFHAGETVSMKHILRTQTRDGLSASLGKDVPTHVVVVHQGSMDSQEIRLDWYRTPSGGLSANSHFQISKTAKMGDYRVYLKDDENRWYGEAGFVVDTFKLPVFSGGLQVLSDDASVLTAPDHLDVDVQLAYMSGGPASRLPVTLSAMSESSWLSFDDFSDYSFQMPRQGEWTDQVSDHYASRIFLDKKSVVLDEQGGIRVPLDNLPLVTHAQQWLFEASFADPNGEVQTLAHSVSVWPAGVQAGIRTQNWAAAGQALTADVVAVTPLGKPRADVPVRVSAIRHVTYSTRKRLVGGFYSYDDRTEQQDLGEVCTGRTGHDGHFSCDVRLQDQGLIELVAVVEDENGKSSSAATDVWISDGQSLWFGGHNDDRMDVVPARVEWKPGEIAEFQVRMPFEDATVLLSVEREGVLHTRVLHLNRSDPVIRLPVQAEWGPNVYVSVLALRGRLHHFPWRALMTEDWKSPSAWYGILKNYARLLQGPSFHVDLAKPSFRLGLASIRITNDNDRLDVSLKAEKTHYQVGEHAQVEVQVLQADGQPAAHGTIAFAAVDKALLALAPNPTWDLLDAMRQTRSYGVRTATAQMQVVGRRHYGRKALPAGGGGGKSPTRELLDTLLLWQSDVTLDEHGKAKITVPLNDAITTFTLVAIADYGMGKFGTGKTDIISTRDLQLISGLPQLVRQGDRYTAQLTVRNMTDRDMNVALKAQPRFDHDQDMPVLADNWFPAWAPDTLQLQAGSAQTLSQQVEIPVSADLPSNLTLKWHLTAQEVEADGDRSATDALVVTQTVLPRIPVRVQQSTTVVLDASNPQAVLPAAPPADALRADQGELMGGVRVQASSVPAVDQEGLKQWFQDRMWGGLEQKASRAIAVQDYDQWAELMRILPDYLDSDGLARYFPGSHQGDEVLTSYLLAVSAQARDLGWEFALPDAERDTMLQALESFVQGRIMRYRWAPVQDLDLRKLKALDALSRYGRVHPRMLDSLRITPQDWPTSGLIDWMGIVSRVNGIPGRPEHLSQLRSLLKARMLARGTTLIFPDTALNQAYWLMTGVPNNQAGLILATLNQVEWDQDRPFLVQGLIAMQSRGAWGTSTANVLGSMALQALSRQDQAIPPEGTLRLRFSAEQTWRDLSWNKAVQDRGSRYLETVLPWSELQQDRGSKPISDLIVRQQGAGQAWVTLSAMAAVVPTAPISSGFTLTRHVEAISQSVSGEWRSGDVYRVSLEIQARSPMTWVALSDALPPGAQVLGSGLGRDSRIALLATTASQAETSPDDVVYRYNQPPAYTERLPDSYHAYYEYLPAGLTRLEYTVRLNTAGIFHLPATRVEGMYEPDVYAELPVPDALTVQTVR